MRRTSLWILVLALLVGACSDDDGPRLATIDELRVVKVSGDQSSPVPDAAPAQTIYATAGASLQSSPGEGWTDEPLVARVEVEGSGGAGLMGPSSATVPSGTLVHWQLPDEAGRLFGGTTATDDSAHVVNRWAPGTRAGTYTAQAGRLVGTEIVTDAAWELVVEPGAVATVYPLKGAERWFSAGDTIDARSLIDFGEDAHGNRITAEVIGETPDSLVTWTASESLHGSTAPEFQGDGWDIVVPSMADYTPIDPGDGTPRYYRLRLHVVVDGAYTPEYAHVRIHVDEPE